MTSFDGDKKIETKYTAEFVTDKRTMPILSVVVITMVSRGRNIRKKSLMTWTKRWSFICAVLWTIPF